MQIDSEKWEQIFRLSDRDFAGLIYTVVYAATTDDAKARMAMAAAPFIKEKMKNTDQNELKKLLQLVGEEKLRGILDSLPS